MHVPTFDESFSLTSAISGEFNVTGGRSRGIRDKYRTWKGRMQFDIQLLWEDSIDLLCSSSSIHLTSFRWWDVKIWLTSLYLRILVYMKFVPNSTVQVVKQLQSWNIYVWILYLIIYCSKRLSMSMKPADPTLCSVSTFMQTSTWPRATSSSDFGGRHKEPT